MRESISQGPTLLLSSDDLAHLLRISKRTVWRRRSDGSLPAAVPFGRFVRWRRDEIERWIAADCPTQSEWKALNEKGGSR